MLEIVQLSLMLVSLLLKTDIKVCFCPIMIFDEENKPLYSVPYIEEDIQHFFHLSGVNQLVVDVNIIERISG